MNTILSTVRVTATAGALLCLFSSCSLRCSDFHAAKASIKVIDDALCCFKMDNGRYPTEQEGLDILVKHPGSPTWTGPYIRGNNILKDPWGTAYRYTLTNGTPVVVSAGPDTKFGTKDDIDQNTTVQPRTTGCMRF